jgi:hypothetical protein
MATVMDDNEMAGRRGGKERMKQQSNCSRLIVCEASGH